ncbi:hypothetical protein OSB04_un000331 [Centaurea solstitialis]|uniref:CCHC-type domain-containing protein n=1 Tax=Centaurea solstitialis TaxID=347529 RepID=A0AA38W3S2_9ASTR|nr:hypothetical protein OSB04_un000331 [Centaurea solstitialis]
MTVRTVEKRKWDGPKGKLPRVEMRGGQNPGVRPCGKCHPVHRGNCEMGPVTCFQCGLPGHMSRDRTSKRSPDCPQLKRGGTPVTRGRVSEAKDDQKTAPAQARGQSFRMTAEEGEEAPDVVTHYSYGTPELLKLLCVKLEPLDHPYVADTANGRVWVREIARGCTIEIDGCLVSIALTPIIRRSHTRASVKLDRGTDHFIFYKDQLLQNGYFLPCADHMTTSTDLLSMSKIGPRVKILEEWYQSRSLYHRDGGANLIGNDESSRGDVGNILGKSHIAEDKERKILGRPDEDVRSSSGGLWALGCYIGAQSKPPTLVREEFHQWKIRMVNFLEGIHLRITEFLHNPPYIPIKLIPRVPATTTTVEVPKHYQPKSPTDWADEDKEIVSDDNRESIFLRI